MMKNELKKIVVCGAIRFASDYPIYDKDCRFNIYDKHKCTHPQHNPPGYISIANGASHKHTCPGCGEQFFIKGSDIRMKAKCK